MKRIILAIILVLASIVQASAENWVVGPYKSDAVIGAFDFDSYQRVKNSDKSFSMVLRVTPVGTDSRAKLKFAQADIVYVYDCTYRTYRVYKVDTISLDGTKFVEIVDNEKTDLIISGTNADWLINKFCK
jgi:hypothetical protein